MDNTLYVVSGFMRTGTSMMMRALENAGMNASYKQSRDEMKSRFADEFYDPNIGGLYELEREDYQKKDFPKGYEGKLIKALSQGVPRMNVTQDGIRAVFMRRDNEEIRQSYQAFFDSQLDAVAEKNTDTFNLFIENIIANINNRKDVLSLDIFWYRDVIENPTKYFTTLKENGWDIDVEKAVSVIDPKCCRFKKEELTIGVI